MKRGKRISVALASTFLSLFSISQLYQNTHHQAGAEGLEEAEWIASSRSWIERKTCQWFGFCGITHLNRSKWVNKSHRKDGDAAQAALTDEHLLDFSEFWTSGKSRPEDWSDDERALREIPKYVLDHAPLMHLFSGEKFWPCDIADHLIHTTPHLNYTPIQAKSDHPNLTDLDELNEFGYSVYLQSDDNVEERPAWLSGESNVPTKSGGRYDDDGWEQHPGGDGSIDDDPTDDYDTWYEAGIGDIKEKGGERPDPTALVDATPTDTPEGEEVVYEDGSGAPIDHEPRMIRRTLDWTAGKKHHSPGGRSDAPAVLVTIDKGDGVVDAFWFFFYSYNLGNVVLNVRFGNHVGDWEHTVVRFHHGKPKAVFFSEHSFGEAYAWDAVEKIGKRPVGYIATGTHAMYATPGTHSYILPWGLLHDITDRGPLWDPALNVHSYTYDYQNDTLRSSTKTPHAPIEWFYFVGHWGDKFYPLSDPRQYRFAGQYHYVNGPYGPRFKNLGRKKVCQGNGDCIIKEFVGGRRAKRWTGAGEGEEISPEDIARLGLE
ncbi:vacuolar sorting-associated protein [Diplodia corticola]|uniref:Vacuolar sorting-associated protein n=1 Tax=Diplodia corticola TaxID=236234 RepID=A0A1J9RYX0_9PEZI|nr:vacuolar sorting-associated protein [Diplodia corticola]OJD32645.1 vacuolar sorting-associated protein [Diplodia corticola]